VVSNNVILWLSGIVISYEGSGRGKNINAVFVYPAPMAEAASMEAGINHYQIVKL